MADGLPPAGGMFAAETANAGHVVAIGADSFAALAAGGPGFIGGELVGRSLFMGGTAALPAISRCFSRSMDAKPRLCVPDCILTPLFQVCQRVYRVPRTVPGVACRLEDVMQPVPTNRTAYQVRRSNSDTIRGYRTVYSWPHLHSSWQTRSRVKKGYRRTVGQCRSSFM